MDHREMVALIRAGVQHPGGVWADLGAGTGNFTFALRELLGPSGVIYAVDRDAKALAALQARLAREPVGALIHCMQADITRSLTLPLLDGILMANLLHFVRDQEALLARLHSQLLPGGRLLVVEYEQHSRLPWVPVPLAFARLVEVAGSAGYAPVAQVGSRRSTSHRQEMYAAVALRGSMLQ
jgi:ubiquinone/menaquinone biosynthesis C-methylase UbiE